MAEIVGVVASGVSIAQIAGQVASSLIKLKTFWDRVKTAPDEINHLLREVESFSLILQHIQDDLIHNPLPELVFNNDCMRQSLELCRTGASELEGLASDLTAKLEGKSGVRMKLNAARVVLKKDDIQSSKRRLKSAIRLLSLAYQCHTSAMIRLQPEIILARLSTTMAASADHRIVDLENQAPSTENQIAHTVDSGSTDLVTQCYTHWTRSPSWLRFLFGSLEYKKRNIRRRGRDNDLREARYKLPELISSRTWDFTYCASLSDWSVNLRTYRTIKFNAPIFDAVRKGDVLCIQSLLSSKKAFITDRDKYGNTLLHYAVHWGHLDVCRLLLSNGADIDLPNYYQSTPVGELFAVYSSLDYNRKVQINLEIARLLVEAGAFNCLDDETRVFKGFLGGISAFQYLQRQICCPYYDLPLRERMEIVYSLQRYNYIEADLIKLALTPSRIDEEMATFVDKTGQTLFHAIVRQLAEPWIYGFDALDSNSIMNGWHILIREVVSAGACLHAVNNYRQSILCHIISAFFPIRNHYTLSKILSVLFKYIQFWLISLKEAGIDLMQYGANEHALHGSGDVENVYYLYPHGTGRVHTHLINFSYRPHPEDWTFWFSEPTDFFAGEFWEMIEREKEDGVELVVPGAWIDTP